jgi:hypothetical protein
MNASTLFESARSHGSDESTVEKEESTVEDKKEVKFDKLIACSTCGAKYKFLSASKVLEDIFPPHGSSSLVVGVETVDNISEDEYTDFYEKVVDDNGYEVEDMIEEHNNTFESIDTKKWYVAHQVVAAEDFIINQGKKTTTALRKQVTKQNKTHRLIVITLTTTSHRDFW